MAKARRRKKTNVTQTITNAAGAAGGAVAGNYVANNVLPMVVGDDPMISNGVLLAASAGLQAVLNTPGFVDSALTGMVSAGAMGLANSFSLSGAAAGDAGMGYIPTDYYHSEYLGEVSGTEMHDHALGTVPQANPSQGGV